MVIAQGERNWWDHRRGYRQGSSDGISLPRTTSLHIYCPWLCKCPVSLHALQLKRRTEISNEAVATPLKSGDVWGIGRVVDRREYVCYAISLVSAPSNFSSGGVGGGGWLGGTCARFAIHSQNSVDAALRLRILL